MNRRLHYSIVTLAVLLIPIAIANGSVDTNSSAGINSAVLQLNGNGIGIGQVELLRAGKPGFDNSSNSNFGTQPAEVFLLDDRVSPTANDQDELYRLSDPDDENSDLIPHATWVAGVVISKDPAAPGVAREADLFSTYGTFSTTPFIPLSDSLAISSQFVATRNGGDIRAINMSFAIPFEVDVGPSGNSKLTEFVDWSATTHDTLYVVANKNDFPSGNAAQPSDNFNGMTVAASSKIGGTYRQVADFVDISQDATGPRTSISLLAPGEQVQLADVGGTIPPPSEDGSSYAAPHVTGTVALLQQQAEKQITNVGGSRWNGNARRHEVMKAVLMNSADKIKDDGLQAPQGKMLGMERTVVKQNGTDDWLDSNAYTDDTIPLDIEMGAGHLNAKRAFQQFNTGEYHAGGAAVSAIGWDYGTTDGFGNIQTYALAQSIAADQFVSITAAWDREVFFEIDEGNIGEFDIGDEFLNNEAPIDLNLYLMPAGETDIENAVARSIAGETTVEHIFYQVQTPGMYEIWVEQASGSEFATQNYALAWMTATPPDLTFGDYSGNGTVGPEDFAAWKSAFGTSVSPGTGADGNGDGIVDAADYTVWRDNLGATSGSGSLASVPEPSTAALLAFGCMGVFHRWRSRGGR